jgi:hypothetical protein
MTKLNTQFNGKEFLYLRVLNFTVGFLHFLQGMCLVLLSKGYSETLTAPFVNIVGTRENFRLVSQTKELFTFKLGSLVALFLFISALAHFLLTLPVIQEWYVKYLKKGINYARWYEYAISSSLMIVAVAVLVGVYDGPTLLLLFSMNTCMIFFGLLMELYNHEARKIEWAAFTCGVFAGAITWTVIIWYFISALGTVIEGGWKLPAFLISILLSLFFLFATFAINMFLQYKKIGLWKDYLFVEKVYIGLSFFTKSVLAWQIFFLVLR